MNTTAPIIVYRSQFEQLQDEFWMDFINQHADTLWTTIQIAGFALVILVVWSVISRLIPTPKSESRFNRKASRRKDQFLNR